MSANPDVGVDVSECVIDRLADEYEVDPVDESSLSELEAELQADPVSREFELNQFKAMFHCGRTDEVESQLAAQVQANGIAADKADCVAAALIATLDDDDLDVLINEEMTDPFFAKFFDATESCGALPS